MTINFSLRDEPWLPVRYLAGQTRDIGLDALFRDAHQIVALAETSPPSLIAQYRVLLAILHRALMEGLGAWSNRDRARWFESGLPLEHVEKYLEKWRDRFWLFHPDFPFMQVAALAELPETRDREKPWTQISLASANGNAPVVFDHAWDSNPAPITAAAAVRALLGFQQFTPGGLVKVIRGSDKAGPLANTAAVMPVADNLAQSLVLALHPPSAERQPDIPVWEKAPATGGQLAADALPASGPNDRYSRLSRAVLLLPEEDGTVRWLRFAAGLALLETADDPDPMVSYRQGSNRLVRLSFREGRAFWRDLPVLLPDSGEKAALPAAVLGHATNLYSELDREPAYQPLLVAGLASDQAKLLRWRVEQIALPTVLLDNLDAANYLRRMLLRSEDLHKLLKNTAAAMIADTLPDPATKESRDRARSLYDTGPATALFFAEAERALPEVLESLGNGDPDAADQIWQEALERAAQLVWNAVYDSLGRSPLALRAEARAYPQFRYRLKTWAVDRAAKEA